MSYKSFKLRIWCRFGSGVIFTQEDGKHIARLEGVTIIGNAISERVTVKWGSGHMAIATI